MSSTRIRGAIEADGSYIILKSGATSQVTFQAGSNVAPVVFTFPSTSGTLSTIGGAETLTGKTIDGDDNTLQDISLSSLKTLLADANKALVRDGSGIVTSALIVNANISASAAIEGSKIQEATGSNPGVITTGGQTFSGGKVFIGAVQSNSGFIGNLTGDVSGTATNVTGTIAIANGGTGQTAKTAAFDALSPATAKGDLIVFDGSDNIRFAVGSDGQVLTADSGEASGLGWSSPLINPMTAIGELIVGGVGGAAISFAVGDDYEVLKSQGPGLLPVWDLITNNNISNDAFIQLIKLESLSGPCVVGVANNTSARPSTIAASTDGHVLRRSGTSIGFGTIVNSATTATAVDTASAIVARDASNRFAVSGVDLTPLNSAPTYTQGRLWYDNVDKTMRYYNDSTGDSVNIGQEVNVKVRNTSGSAMTAGQVVRVTGATGNVPNVSLAQANSFANARVYAVLTEDIADNATGYATIAGLIKNLNLSAFSEGDIVYLSPTVAGGLTATRPSAPNYAMAIGAVASNNGSSGRLIVKLSIFRALGLGSANQVSGMNSAGTEEEYKTLAVGTSGTDFAIAHSANTITLNLPDASASARGAVTTAAQTFQGVKTIQEATSQPLFVRNTGAGNSRTTYSNSGGTLGISGFTSGGAYSVLNSSSTEILNITSAGAFTANLIHNRGSGNITSGSYTPTATLGTNAAGVSSISAKYSRVGNIVTVCGQMAVTCTAAANTSTRVQITLPVTSNLGSSADCVGVCNQNNASGSASGPGIIQGDSATDRAELVFNAVTTAASNLSFSFQYEVI